MSFKLYCPICGKKDAIEGDSSPNGGGLYVAEGLDACDEYYDKADPYKCTSCGTSFYMGDNSE